MKFIGIDPGISGALALITPHGLQILADIPVMLRSAPGAKVRNQVNGAALNEILKDWTSESDKNEIMVVIEKVQAMPGKMGGAMAPAATSSSTFSLGLSAGIIEGVVAARGLPHMLVHPATWKAYFKLAKGKDAARARAQRLYPAADIARKKDHNRAEAILLARYGQEQQA